MHEIGGEMALLLVSLGREGGEFICQNALRHQIIDQDVVIERHRLKLSL